MPVDIHPTAIVHESAKLGNGTTVGPYAIIEEDVILGENNIVESHAVLKKHLRLGNGNHVHSHAVLGDVPQDLVFDASIVSYLEAGDNNTFREFSNIHRSKFENGKTIIGNECYIMATAHIAHDCIVKDNLIICNSSPIAGHVQVDESVFISGNVGVHQFCKIGAYSIIGNGTKVMQDIPPFALCDGHPAKVYQLNLVGMRRNKFSREEIDAIQEIHKAWYKGGLSKKDFIAKYDGDADLHPRAQYFVDFIKRSERGICPHV